MVANVNVNPKRPEINKDGLSRRYGLTEAVVEKVGDLNTYGDEHCIKVKVAYTDVALGTDATHNFILSYQSIVPKGAFITRASFLVTETWDSASSDVALNFGLVKDDATATVEHTIVDADGLFDSIAKTALDTAGAILNVYKADSSPASTTWVGAELGSARTENQLITTFWETHVPTSGAGILSVYYTGA